MVEVFTTRPDLVNRSTKRRAQPVFEQPAAESGRQRVGDLLHARMQELGDLDDLAVGGLHLGPHALEAARPDLQLGDADGVLVGHAERKLARGLGQQVARAVAVPLVDLGDRLQPVEIFARIGDVLVVRQPLEPRRA